MSPEARFDELLLPLYASENAITFLDAAAALLRATIDSDYCGVAICEPKLKRTLCVWWPDSLPIMRYIPAFEPIADQHPLLKGWARERDVGLSMRISDCVENEAFRNSAVYSEIFKPMRARAQVGVWAVVGHGEHVEISASRCGRDFSSADVTMLARIRPHIAQAYKTVRLLAELRALPAPAEQLIVAGQRMVMMDATRYVPELRETRRNRSSSVDALKHVARLTPRELEVLHWVREGKTNPQIATILGTNWRTVQKHLENVFRKLNVETRTAASTRAAELGLS
jgi:DNA-binding CsgD family transcriptional regulator